MTRLFNLLTLPLELFFEWRRREALGHLIHSLQRERTHLLDNLERRRR